MCKGPDVECGWNVVRKEEQELSLEKKAGSSLIGNRL